MIKAVVFDADGVINHTERFSDLAVQKYNVPREKLITFFSTEFQLCLIGKSDLKEELVKRLSKWGLTHAAEEYLQLWFQAENHVDKRMVQSVETIKQQGVACYVATNQEKYRTEYMKNHMGFSKLFDAVFSSAYLGAKKPDEAFYHKIMELLKGLEKDEILFWDDTDENVKAAEEFGWNAEKFMSFEDYEKKMEQYGLL